MTTTMVKRLNSKAKKYKLQHLICDNTHMQVAEIQPLLVQQSSKLTSNRSLITVRYISQVNNTTTQPHDFKYMKCLWFPLEYDINILKINEQADR